MKSTLIKIWFILGFLIAAPSQALTINGTPKASPLKVCFDDGDIGIFVQNIDELNRKKKWVRDAIENESWGYYTNMKFTGWGNCASSPGYNIRITANGAVSYGNTIELPFRNISDPSFERYHIQSGAVHEIGHQLGFPHEHVRPNSTHYVNDTNNQKFRFRAIDGT